MVILDEPTVGLDPNQIREIRTLVRELGGAHSVILSTHILPEVEAICDRVQIMHHGSDRLQRHDRRAEGVSQRPHVVLGLQRPPPAGELGAVPGVTAVEPVDPVSASSSPSAIRAKSSCARVEETGASTSSRRRRRASKTCS